MAGALQMVVELKYNKSAKEDYEAIIILLKV